jgi:hypothetical protein
LEVLRSAGFAKIEIEAFDARVSSGNLDAPMAVLTKVGLSGTPTGNPSTHFQCS